MYFITDKNVVVVDKGGNKFVINIKISGTK
jgi:hypothetical protein